MISERDVTLLLASSIAIALVRVPQLGIALVTQRGTCTGSRGCPRCVLIRNAVLQLGFARQLLAPASILFGTISRAFPSDICHRAHAVCCALLGPHAWYQVLIGAYDPTLCPI